MFFPKAVAPMALLATTVLADSAAIVSALTTINTETLALDSAVASWYGDLLGTIPIVAKSAELLAAIDNGTAVAKASAALSSLESISVALEVVTLASSVNSTLTTLIAAKPKFDHLPLSDGILLNLELEKASNGKLSAAITAKVPTSLQATAEGLAAEIDDSFDEAIDVYNPFAGL